MRLDVLPGEAVGLIGESGSGKSTLALALLRLLEWKGGRASGWILWKGRDLLQLKEREMRQIRGREISLVLQSAATSLNPGAVGCVTVIDGDLSRFFNGYRD